MHTAPRKRPPPPPPDTASFRDRYRLFNEIGVRHLTIVDRREHVIGIITRKDILPETMEERVLAAERLREAEDILNELAGEKLPQGLPPGGVPQQEGVV